MMMEAQSKLRQSLLAWRGQCGWTAEQISSAMHVVRTFDKVSWSAIEQFCRGSRILRPSQVQAVQEFISRWPDPGPFAEWKSELAREARVRKLSEVDEVAARLDALEESRREHIRRCLAAERPRLRSRFPAGVLQPLEALS